jgi:hypothetical protein
MFFIADFNPKCLTKKTYTAIAVTYNSLERTREKH